MSLKVYHSAIGRRWKLKRRIAGLTQAQAVEKVSACGLHCDIQALARMERGESLPKNLDLLIPILCKIYACSADDIYYPKKERPNHGEETDRTGTLASGGNPA